jgi:high-affinity iron transporter
MSMTPAATRHVGVGGVRQALSDGLVIGWRNLKRIPRIPELAIFAMGVRVNLGRFFTWTGVLLVFVAAGLVVYAVSEFTEAGFLPTQPPLFDLSRALPQTSPVGSVLNGMFGYRSAPSALQVIAWLAYLVPVLVLYLTDWRPRVRRSAPASA